MAKIWSVDSMKPDGAAIEAAAAEIHRGGIVVLPTHGLYGLGGDAFNRRAIERIFRLKGRAINKALLVLIANVSALARVALPSNAMATHLMRRFWPGGVTFVLPASPKLPSAINGNSGKIGVRLVAHPVAAALIREVGSPLTGTSANISGAGGSDSVDQLDADIVNGIDGVLDAGQLAGGSGSTVVDVTGPVPEILREGAISGREIMASYDDFAAQHQRPK